MALETRILSSRVARRIFVLFVACALVPITTLAVISFGQVSAQLYEQGQERLGRSVRTVGQSIVERLLLVEAEVRSSADRPLLENDDSRASDPSPMASRRFLGVTTFRSGQPGESYGEIAALPDLDAGQRDRLGRGRSVLLSEARPGEPPAIFLVRRLDDAGTPDDLIVAAVDPAYLWAGSEDTLPRNNHLCVFDEHSVPLFCTRPVDGAVPEAVTETIRSDGAGALEWSVDDEQLLAAFWSMPLDFQFGVPRWTVMLSESTADVLAPMASFRRIFPFVVLLSMWVVLLLSISQIRRSMVPLEKLREGTRRLAARDFDSRVEVASGDEFEELAASFNEMAGRLGKQFAALETIAEVDHTILSSLDIEKIVHTVLQRSNDLFDCAALSITLVSPDQQKVPRTYTLRAGEGTAPWVETTFLSPDDFERFEVQPEMFEIEPGSGAPAFLATLARYGLLRFVVFPMFINHTPAGAISFAFDDRMTLDDDDLLQARQLTDQVAVALSNAHLVEDLDALNWGALTALARTVDAKSSWTAGHSERVTTMGLKIGEVLGLDKDALDTMHRGGLLHDIGKIGVPASILDKPARLTEEEYALMKKHPEIGANILRPISAYADVIPIVQQHHERWDGSGYPDGLVGEQIHFYARIFAVADVYDALISDRPYRPGLPVDEVVRTIAAGDGTEFDPRVVSAFLGVMTEEGYGLRGSAPATR